MEPMKALLRIRLEDEDVFLMSEYELESKLSLKILNIKRSEAYLGQASNIELRSQAASIRIAFNDFIDKFTEALFINNPGFIYCIDTKDEKFVFKWKSIDTEETIITLGSVEMTKRDSAYVFSEVLQSLSEETSLLVKKVRTLNQELSTSKIHTAEALKQLSVATEVNQNLEIELYSKFVLVLNEKKRKIRDLQGNVQQNVNSSGKPHKKSTHILSSDSADEEDAHLYPRPSTSNTKNGLLFIDETKRAVQSTQNRMRNRKVPVSKNCKPMDVLMSSKSTVSEEKVTNDESDESLLAYL